MIEVQGWEKSMINGKLKRFFKVLEGIKEVLILPHNDPDPDAIASVAALQYLLEKSRNIHSYIAYQGIIGRAENRALVKYLNVPLNIFTESDLERGLPVVLVDTQAGVGNNPLPPHVLPYAVIDHHPWRETSAKVPFAAVYPETGACATILNSWLQEEGIELPKVLATALFYGIKTDTRGLSRDATPDDVDAYFYLHPLIDMEALVNIEYAQVPVEYFRSFSVALQKVRIFDERVVIAHIGSTSYPDMAAEVADELLRVENCQWVICSNIYNHMLILSVRTHLAEGDADQVVRAAVGIDGTAGGHGMMAGGQINIHDKDIDQLISEINERTLRFLDVPAGTVGKPLILSQ